MVANRNFRIYIVMGLIVVAFSVLTLFVISQESSRENLPSVQIDERAHDVRAQEIIDRCEKDVHCAVMLLQELANKEERSVVITSFQDVIAIYKESSVFCHSYAHHLGMWLYAYVQNVSQALSYANPILCGGALYHGIVQNYMMSRVSFAETDPDGIDIRGICPGDTATPTIGRWECIHGVGHGLTTIYNYDVVTAVQRCNDLDKWERVSCSKGLFMENMINFEKYRVGAFKKKDIFFPCNAIDESFAPSCYHYHATHIYYEKRNIKEALKECENVPEEFMNYCYRGMGRLIAYAISTDFGLSSICKQIDDWYKADCYKGIVMVFADNRSTEEALNFCKFVPAEFKRDCYGEVGKWILMVYPTGQERAKECSKAENSEYAKLCMNADLKDLKIL